MAGWDGSARREIFIAQAGDAGIGAPSRVD